MLKIWMKKDLKVDKMATYTKEDLKNWEFKPDYNEYFKPEIGDIKKENDKYFCYSQKGWGEVSEQFILKYMNSKHFTIMLEKQVQRQAEALCKLIEDKLKGLK